VTPSGVVSDCCRSVDAVDATDDFFELFLEVYGTLPRAGPGGDEHTLKALGLVPPPLPRAVLDLGCGPGAHTVVLASALPSASLLAVDLLPQMVDEANRRFDAAGGAPRVRAVVGDMAAPPVEPGSQDLIWCEGAIYNLGVTEGLQAWRPLLRAGGTVVFSEPVWLVDTPPKEIHDWWIDEYPVISDRTGVVARIEAASYRLLASFELPASAWWVEYYEPMQDRIAALAKRRPDDPVAQQVVATATTEIARFQRFSDCYTYEFFVVQPTG